MFKPKGNQMALNSLKEIATLLGKEEAFCQVWKNMREAKKGFYGKSANTKWNKAKQNTFHFLPQ